MRTKLILLCFFVSFSFLKPLPQRIIAPPNKRSPSQRPWQLYGLWQGLTHNGKSLSFLFERSHNLTIISGKDIIGKPFREDSPSENIHFEVNLKSNPATIDLVMEKDGKTETIKGIIRFFDKHRIMIYSKGKSQDRPEKFDLQDSKNIFLLFKK